MFPLLQLVLLAAVPVILAAPANVKRASAPTVTISQPEATIVGSSGSNSVDSFNGIPFAQAPTVQATGSAKACPQFYFTTDTSDFPVSVLGELINIPLFQTVTNAGEDCLSVSVQRPSGTEAGADLPVLVWIFGGGFELGSSSMYDGSGLVSASMELNMPIVFVAINYRVGGFGFMPGSEILKDGSANLGLLDQRLALEWIADNIKGFGGDPSKVTIWGESAGSISVFDQMALYDGDHTYNGSPLFRAGIMNSGNVVPADRVDGAKGQAIYDTVVESAGCGSATDTLECLRGLDYTTFLNAANSVPGLLSYHSVALSYLPRPDGTVLTDSPENLVMNGKYASVPFIVGDQEDEGTIFALFQSNISTTDQIVDYLQDLFFADASRAQLEELVATYPDTTTDGSPFRTSIFNNWYPQYKRLAAILGDLTFTITRRAFLTLAQKVKPDVPFWSYLSSYDYGTPILGTFHGSDLLQVFYGLLPNYASRSIHSYYFSFVYDLDPNSRASSYMDWPQWSANQTLMNFFNNRAALLADDFRQDTFDFILANVASFHI
ncbi:secreted lipase [Penicillium canariense]|uniref:Carboxylic ester hydrolase n=1 Tax=Penicillium canariense TaxID=189055 RepID=A0A9W9HLV0_9EURO|nr:secreted lipase [Penicillium canariense]KAJ5150856.1 secreted lipase [Penicillium canariense]